MPGTPELDLAGIGVAIAVAHDGKVLPCIVPFLYLQPCRKGFQVFGGFAQKSSDAHAFCAHTGFRRGPGGGRSSTQEQKGESR